jgi:FixJ family two-component response regulator
MATRNPRREREQEVLGLVAGGLPNKLIARHMGIDYSMPSHGHRLLDAVTWASTTRCRHMGIDYSMPCSNA